MSDGPIHLAPPTDKYSEASVTTPVWLTQSHLDGLQTLMAWCDGVKSGGGGNVPGHFELVMHYRLLRAAITKHYDPSAT
jgi:hypothetical protein